MKTRYTLFHINCESGGGLKLTQITLMAIKYLENNFFSVSNNELAEASKRKLLIYLKAYMPLKKLLKFKSVSSIKEDPKTTKNISGMLQLEY
jgi:hypothetical protein